MTWLIWIGAGLAGLGLVGIVMSVARVVSARRAGQDDNALRETMRRALPLNLGAFFLSVFGLIIVIVGVVL